MQRPRRLVWTEPGAAGGMTTTITFTDVGGGRTEVVTHQTRMPEAYLSPQAQAGFATSLDRFARYISTRSGNQPEGPAGRPAGRGTGD